MLLNVIADEQIHSALESLRRSSAETLPLKNKMCRNIWGKYEAGYKMFETFGKKDVAGEIIIQV